MRNGFEKETKMIDLAIEQELYLKEFYNDLFIEQIEFNGDEFVWKMSKTTTELEECNHGWRAWLASVSRDGYKLVPVEMHWHKADELASDEWERHKALFCSDNRDMTALQVEEFRLCWCKNKAHQIMNGYKAIIGASE